MNDNEPIKKEVGGNEMLIATILFNHDYEY